MLGTMKSRFEVGFLCQVWGSDYRIQVSNASPRTTAIDLGSQGINAQAGAVQSILGGVLCPEVEFKNSFNKVVAQSSSPKGVSAGTLQSCHSMPVAFHSVQTASCATNPEAQIV